MPSSLSKSFQSVDNSPEVNMEALVKLQEDVKIAISKGKVNFKKSPKDRITQAYVETRLETLEEQWKLFTDTHRTIISDIDTDEYRSSSYFTNDMYEATQEIYCDYKTELKEALNKVLKITASNKTPISQPTSAISMPQVKLPKISIPTFSGKYTEWTTFKDLFESLVHKNESLENVHKLHYLKAHLAGEAEQLLRHIPVTDANYNESWSLLKKRFSNKKYLSNCLLSRLTSQTNISSVSSKAIKDLLDTTCDCLNGLKNLGLQTDAWDVIVIFLISAKLDGESRKLWESEISISDDHPTMSQFKNFLEHRFRSLEFLPSPSVKPNAIRNKITVHHAAEVSCPFCSDGHRLYNCKNFAKEQVDARRNFVQSNGLCYNCMCPGHSVFTCRQTSRCRVCKKKHHSLLHPSSPTRSTDNEVKSPSVDKSDIVVASTSLPDSEVNDVVACNSNLSSEVLLATALVRVESRSGNNLTFRSLLDQGSQASFITESAVQSLGLKRVPSSVTISGVGDRVDPIVSKAMVNLKLQSIHDPNYIIPVKAHVLNKLTSVIPARKVNIQLCQSLIQLKLADPKFHTPNKIDLLLGADIYSQILVEGLIKGSPGLPIAQNTKLGWILSGQVRSESVDNSQSELCLNSSIISLHTHVKDDELLKRFWELESEPSSIISKKIFTEEEQQCESFYVATTTRDDEGRYIVKLPFRSPEPQCRHGESLSIASRRLEGLERRLNKNPELKIQYSEVMAEYLTLNHMELVPAEQKIKADAVYLPHHAVVREDKTTTKVRVVFNASSPGTNGISLNNDLMVGPTLQLDLRHIIMRWRRHPVALIADIVKMYRQVKVAAEDTDYQRVLWKDEAGIQHYRMLRVTFGTASAPYLAVRTLHQLAQDEVQSFPMVAERIIKDFYMDDLMTGCQTVDEGLKVYKEMNEIMKKGCFELQKWATNSKELMQRMGEDLKDVRDNLEIGKGKEGTEVKKVLGLSWNQSTDEFEYTVRLPQLSYPVTKRKVLSDISRLFDPLGWIAPSIIQAKIFIQKLWMAGLDWDQELPERLLNEWVAYRDQLSSLSKFTIPRWMHTSCTNAFVELHGFCDASKDAYAAVVYLRVIDMNSIVHVNLITSKTKVSPIKVVSIPRLELCGAVLLTKLLAEVTEVLQVPKDHVHAWTDSQVVLAWLSSHPSRWKTFIANRVSDILTTFDRKQWSHVRSHENPADCASRGIQPRSALELDLWKNGPSWLTKEHIEYSPLSCNQDTNLEERARKDVVCNATSTEEGEICTRFSSLRRLVRVLSYCRRFILAASTKAKRQPQIVFPKWITCTEQADVTTTVVKLTQGEHFKKEVLCCSKNVPISKKSSIRSLNPFLDSDGVLRVGGRLHNSQLPNNTKNPIVMPYKSHLTTLIVADAHERTLHGGPQLMLNYIRSKYWIVNAKRAIKAFVHKCVVCIRYSSRTTHQLMGQLPSSRVTPSRPFQQSGVDYAGPIAIRTSKGRGHRSTKGYICLFVCMATRAIHLEAVSDLTSEGFIAAFKRFVARRGHCSELWSDNGTNFVGASRELSALLAEEKSFVKEDIAEWLATNGTEWHYIPPRTPNFGGLWEAGVKSTKHHLRRVIGTTTLTFEEITTVLAQIEACLNSRPISQISDNPDDPCPLTPGHFLVGGPLLLPPDSNYESSNVGSLRRWQHSQKIVQDFWRKWSQEYLVQFLQRHKWSTQIPEPQIGDVVLVKEDDLPPARWLYGIIVDKHPGADKITRVVSLRCKGSTIKRPVSKLCVLPVAN